MSSRSVVLTLLGLIAIALPFVALGQTGGSGTINQLSPFVVSGGTVRLASSTANFRIPSLPLLNCIGTSVDGTLQLGSCSGGGSGGTDTLFNWNTGTNVISTDGVSTTATTSFSTNGLTANTATITNATSTTGWFSSIVRGLNALFTNATSTNFQTTQLGVGSDYITDLTGTGLSIVGNALTATNDHVAVTVSGARDYITLSGQDLVRGVVDVSDDTNLTADGTEIVLTADALSLGTTLTFTSATATNLATTFATTSVFYGAGLTDCSSASNALTYVSSTGKFGCNTILGGGGGGGGGWATTTDNNAEVGEIVAYTPYDAYIGGSSSSTASFNFDQDSSLFTIGSPSSVATGSILTQFGVLLFGSSTAETINLDFRTSDVVRLTSSTSVGSFDFGSIKASSTYASTSVLTVQGNIYSPKSDGCASWASGILTSLGVACGSGSGGGSISTSSIPVAGNLAYWTSASALSDVATGTLTESVLGLDIDNSTRGLVGGSAAFSLTSGYAIPSTTRMALWDSASGTVTSVAMTVPTGLSIAGTPITSVGTLALTYGAGYEGFLTSASTSLFAFRNTPSTVITAGTGIDWSGNTLNGVYTAGDGITLNTEDFDCDTANGATFGCLTSADWTVFNNKVSSTSIDTSAELAALLTDEIGTAQLVFNNPSTFSFGSATSSGSSTIASLTVTNGTTTNATSTNLAISNSIKLFGGASVTSGNALCIQLTGSADLCDGSDATGGGSAATGTTLVCATGCPYSDIQTALDAGVRNIELKEETYAGPLRIKFSDTKITGAGATSTIITCDASVNSPCVAFATTTRLTRQIIRDLTIDNTNVSLLGTGLDTSDTSKVYTSNIRVVDFNIAHLHQDTTNSSFYSHFENMDYYASSSCFKTGGTKSNDNSIDTARCIVIAPNGIGYNFIDSEGWILSNINAEPGSLIGTGLYVDGTSIGITVINPWFEGNATGTEIRAGALNTSIKGGRITAGTLGVYDGGTNTFLDSTLVSSNTTNHSCPSTCLGTYVNSNSTFGAPHILIGTTTPGNSYARLAATISTSEATANLLTLNNAGAFATAPAGIAFTHSAGGFSGPTGRIYVNPGSGFTNAQMNFAVADSAKALQDRMVIDVAGDVGIGSTTPGHKFTLQGGNAYFGGNIFATGTATTTNLSVTTGVDLFGGGLKTTANSLCIQLTGSSDLCDGIDGGGGGSSKWTDGATPYTYLTQTTYDLALGSNATATAPFWWDVSATTSYIGNGGAGDSVITVGTTTPWTFGFDDTDDSFSIATGTSLGTNYSMFLISTTSTLYSSSTVVIGNSETGGRMALGGSTYFGLSSPLDQLLLKGRVRNETWMSYECPAPYQATAISTEVAMASCPQYVFMEDTTGTFTGVQSNGFQYMQLGGTAANDGSMLTIQSAAGTNWMRIATNTPSFEVTARIGTIVNTASTTRYIIGFTNVVNNSATMETTPTAGCFFMASSTNITGTGGTTGWPNWYATCKTSDSASTTVDTGIASTSITTGAGAWQKFRIDADGNKVTFWIKNGTANMVKVAEITSNIPATVALQPQVYFARGAGTAAIQFDLLDWNLWMRKVHPNGS